jgi:hypothetical protein
VGLRRRIAELEARIEALEEDRPVDYAMPARPDLGVAAVEPHSLWREECAEYAHIQMYDIDDDRAQPGVYL